MVMQLVRSHNFGPGSALFLPVLEHEWQALWGLPAWGTRLFMCLAAFSDFKKGTVKTSYGELLNALQPDQPARGKRLPTISLQQVRTMLAAFEKLLILARDKGRSETEQVLFFQIAPRVWKSTSTEKLNRDENSHKRASTPYAATNSSSSQHEENTKENSSFKKNFLKPPTPKTASYPQTEAVEGGVQQTPRGGLNEAAARHAPPPPASDEAPAVDSRTAVMRAQALRERFLRSKTDPQGGRAPTPPKTALRPDPEQRQQPVTPSPVGQGIPRPFKELERRSTPALEPSHPPENHP